MDKHRMTMYRRLLRLIILAAYITCSGCSDFLGMENVGDRDEDFYLRLYQEPRGLVEYVYADMGFGYDVSAAYLTDEAVRNKYTSDVATGGITPDNNPFNIWNKSYDNIRNLQLYIQKVHNSEIPFYPYDSIRNDKVLRRYYGDSYFLKAWHQWELLKVYGGEASNGEILGFPIVNEILPNEAYINLERAPYDSCVNQIVSDLDTAFKYLPLKYDGVDADYGDLWRGKAGGLAAMALKSRVLLWAASPAFNKSNNSEKWHRALDAAMDVIRLDDGLKVLYRQEYNNTDNDDHYWRTRSSAKSAALENAHFPPSLFGRGECNPSKNLIDAIPMSNGYPIDYFDPARSLYDQDKPFEGRDDRFQSFFFYNNDSVFRGIEPFWGSNLEIYEGGKDFWGGFRVDAGTRTGFYLKKFMNNLDLNTDQGAAKGLKTDYSICERLGRSEIYLNLAEAAVGAGFEPREALPDGYSAYDCIIGLRDKALITNTRYVRDMALNPSDFLTLIKNERMIELCFQGLRFFDLRRWLTPLSEINQAITGVKVIKNNDGSFTYEEVPDVEQRNYSSNTYYLPLPEDEVVKSGGKLLQNKGW